MNTKLFPYAVFILSVLLTSFSLHAAPPFELPSQANEIAKGVYHLGKVKYQGQDLEGIAFIHYAKPDSPGGGKKPGSAGGSTKSTCYAFIANSTSWNVAEDYVLDFTNISGMSESFVSNTIQTGLKTWNDQVNGTIFGSQIAGTVDGADTVSPDDKNEVYFSEIAEPNVIAVTITWGIFSGPPAGRKLVEWDQVYDDVEFAWGNADTNTSVMDLLNIAVHELGHAAGMGHPESACTEESMFAYAAAGERKKRDLNDGDITGIKKLYK